MINWISIKNCRYKKRLQEFLKDATKDQKKYILSHLIHLGREDSVGFDDENKVVIHYKDKSDGQEYMIFIDKYDK